MNILEVIKRLQVLADKDPTLEVYAENGMDPSDYCPIDDIRIDKPSLFFDKDVVIIVSQ